MLVRRCLRLLWVMLSLLVSNTARSWVDILRLLLVPSVHSMRGGRRVVLDLLVGRGGRLIGCMRRRRLCGRVSRILRRV